MYECVNVSVCQCVSESVLCVHVCVFSVCVCVYMCVCVIVSILVCLSIYNCPSFYVCVCQCV